MHIMFIMWGGLMVKKVEIGGRVFIVVEEKEGEYLLGFFEDTLDIVDETTGMTLRDMIKTRIGGWEKYYTELREII